MMVSERVVGEGSAFASVGALDALPTHRLARDSDEGSFRFGLSWSEIDYYVPVAHNSFTSREKHFGNRYSNIPTGTQPYSVRFSLGPGFSQLSESSTRREDQGGRS